MHSGVRGLGPRSVGRTMSPSTQSEEQDRWVGVRSGGSAQYTINKMGAREGVDGKVKRKGQGVEISNVKGFLFLPWLSGTILKDLLPLLVPIISPMKSTADLPQHLSCRQKDGV